MLILIMFALTCLEKLWLQISCTQHLYTTSLYKQHKSRCSLIQMIRTTSEAIMISALAWSHILHINKASVSEFLSQANRPTSSITNKPIQESQMAHLKQPWLFHELGKPEPWNQSWLQIIFPWALGASKTTHKLAPQKKNTNAGTIHYLELV